MSTHSCKAAGLFLTKQIQLNYPQFVILPFVIVLCTVFPIRHAVATDAPVAPQWQVGEDFRVVANETEPEEHTHSWDNRLKPPQLSNPRVFRTIESLPLTNFKAMAHTLCDGKEYLINVGSETDVYIDLTGQESLRYPLQIRTARKVIIRGLSMKLMVQPGCEPNKLNNYKKGGGLLSNANIHPRTPGGAGIQTFTSDDVWIEGADIDITGHNIDAIVHRHHKIKYNQSAIQFKDVAVVNSRIVGWDGGNQFNGPIGDQIHADLWHTQGDIRRNAQGNVCVAIDQLHSLSFENVVAEHSHQGVTLVGDSCENITTQSVFVRNYSRMPDKRYDDDDILDDQWGIDTFKIKDNPLHIENFWYYYGPKSTWIVGMQLQGQGIKQSALNDQKYYGDCSFNNPVVDCHPELNFAEIVPHDFAPKRHVGRNYISPFKTY